MKNHKMNELENITQNNLSDRWLSTKEVCKYSSCSVSTIYRSIQKGVLQVSKKTGKNLYKKSWIDRWLDG